MLVLYLDRVNTVTKIFGGTVCKKVEESDKRFIQGRKKLTQVRKR